jgi:hypothetical protein
MTFNEALSAVFNWLMKPRSTWVTCLVYIVVMPLLRLRTSYVLWRFERLYRKAGYDFH